MLSALELGHMVLDDLDEERRGFFRIGRDSSVRNGLLARVELRRNALSDLVKPLLQAVSIAIALPGPRLPVPFFSGGSTSTSGTATLGTLLFALGFAVAVFPRLFDRTICLLMVAITFCSA
jgi:hypothetical protein